MFNLSLAQRFILFTGFLVTAQVCVGLGVYRGWSPGATLGSSTVFVVLGFLIYLSGATAVKGFVASMVTSAATMAAGDLSTPVPVEGNDAARTALGAFASLQQALRALLATVNEGAQQVATAASEIASGNQDLSVRTEQSGIELQRASSALREMSESARIGDALQRVRRLAEEATQRAHGSGSLVSQTVAAMEEVSKSSKKIADIIGVIDGIAFQTNILALNAAVEAARAGEQGRGFAVVATEVRNLAQRSASAAKEIKDLITESVNQVDVGAKLVNDTGDSMHAVVASIEEVAGLVGECESTAQSQLSGMADVSEAVARLDDSTQQNAALVEQSAAAAESLRDQAARLSEALSRFRL
ncbi:MAG TPA: methyl-accepting chemotaxis protein [Burkholderiaceae bacterium]